MHFFVLSAIMLAAAAALWCVQAAGRRDDPASSAGDGGVESIRNGEIDAHSIEALGAAVDALRAVMDHPALGGPGFITVHFPPPAASDGQALVTAQYPNIREALYRRIVRRELEPSELMAEGVPEKLLALLPDFETESGGMVLLTIRVTGLDRALIQAMTSRRGRQAALGELTEQLRRRYPEWSVRCLGGELLLSPLRETAAV